MCVLLQKDLKFLMVFNMKTTYQLPARLLRFWGVAALFSLHHTAVKDMRRCMHVINSYPRSIRPIFVGPLDAFWQPCVYKAHHKWSNVCIPARLLLVLAVCKGLMNCFTWCQGSIAIESSRCVQFHKFHVNRSLFSCRDVRCTSLVHVLPRRNVRCTPTTYWLGWSSK